MSKLVVGRVPKIVSGKDVRRRGRARRIRSTVGVVGQGLHLEKEGGMPERIPGTTARRGRGGQEEEEGGLLR